MHSAPGTRGQGMVVPGAPMAPFEKVTGGEPVQVRVYVSSPLAATLQVAPSWPSVSVTGALPGQRST